MVVIVHDLNILLHPRNLTAFESGYEQTVPPYSNDTVQYVDYWLMFCSWRFFYCPLVFYYRIYYRNMNNNRKLCLYKTDFFSLIHTRVRQTPIWEVNVVGCSSVFLLPDSNCSALSAVSYTHLDVYKRQLWPGVKSPIARRGTTRNLPPSRRAVSYTHLDVYKRQQHTLLSPLSRYISIWCSYYPVHVNCKRHPHYL